MNKLYKIKNYTIFAIFIKLNLFFAKYVQCTLLSYNTKKCFTCILNVCIKIDNQDCI
jgi:hypothetical protein